jgi:hypothetical protein
MPKGAKQSQVIRVVYTRSNQEASVCTMMKALKYSLLLTFSLLGRFVAKGSQLTIFDTDYGAFIDERSTVAPRKMA